MKQLILFFAITILLTQFVFAQVDKDSELYKTIISKDKLLFDVGFNTCNITRFEELLSDKLEFFHDKVGISDKKTFLEGFRNGLCRSPGTYQSRRELLDGSTEIYPLHNGDLLYGAIQTGIHRFYETESGKKEVARSTAKFTHVWQLENEKWKLTKGLSYDHQLPTTGALTPSNKIE